MKKSNKVKSQSHYLYFYIFLIVMVAVLAFIFPYTHDDWAWGSQLGIDRLNSLFKDYNGRWVGNILVMALTRSRLFRTFIVTLSFVSIIYFIRKLFNRNESTTLLAILLTLGIPINILAQGVAWTSGFANYVIPIAIVLVFLYFNKEIFTDSDVKISNRFIIIFLILGFINSLFVEHMTIYNVLLALISIGYYYIKKKKFVIPDVSYFIGALSGAVLMFSNGAYANIFNATDSYRNIEQGNIFIRSLNTYFNEIQNYLIWNNLFLNLVLCGIVLFSVYKFYQNKKNQKKINLLIKLAISFIIVFALYNVYVRLNGEVNIFIYSSCRKYIEGIMGLLFPLSIFIICMSIFEEKTKKKRIIFELISIYIMAGPLLIVQPIGPRCFFPIYIMFVLLVCEIACSLFDREDLLLNRFIMISSATILFSIVMIYGYIAKIDFERINYIKSNNTKESLVLPKLPHTDYMWGANPVNSVFYERFKKFYDINDKTEVDFIDYEEWKKKR